MPVPSPGQSAPPAFSVTHLATSPGDGAGTAAVRQHEALLEYRVRSRFLTAIPRVGEARPDFAVVPSSPPGLFRRIRDRFPFLADRFASLRQRTDAALLASRRTGESHEGFSLPLSRDSPECHPWIQTADIVHLHWVAGLLDFPRFFGCVQKPLVWTLHDQQPYLGGFHYAADQETAPSLHDLDDLCRSIKHAALSRVQALTVVGNSRWNTEAAIASGFFPRGTRFETIYYPLDAGRFAPRDKLAAKAALGLPVDRCVIGFASTSLDNRRKGLADLLSALALLEAKAGPPLALLSFGREPGQPCGAAVDSPWLHLGLLDSDSLKSAAYSAMDIFAVPSHAEAFGQTAIEALACGTAVIAAKVGGLVEALDDGHCGRLFEPGNVAELAETIRQLAVDPTARQALASTGRAHVVARHAPGVCARRYLDVYADTLQQSHWVSSS